MSVKFTPEQQKVIDLRNRNILVSAAAGSGKTAVLVERIITRLTKDEKPLDVDRLLVVTYTEAAAAEMKERIHMAIEKALDEQPGNAHLERQATLIHQAQITTIHQFCLSVIREYFHEIDLDPGFSIGAAGEIELLRQDVLEDVLEKAYLEADSQFIDFVESFAFGKSDKQLENLIIQLYDASRSYPNPTKWLQQCVEQYDIQSPMELERKPFVQAIMDETTQYIQEARELLDYAIELCEEEDGPASYKENIQYDIGQLEMLTKANTFADMQTRIRLIEFPNLKACRSKEVCPTKKEQVQTAHKTVKGLIAQLKEQYFFDTVERLQSDMLASKSHMQTLCNLVIAFETAFHEAKMRKNLIDFSDMEHYALQILTREENGKHVPSAVAESYQFKYEEVMIDEYQDSNYVQDTILTSVSKVSAGGHNIFMVGDVKQSIYRFRLSMPELFMEKYNRYSTKDSQEQRIDLHKNFRSRREVLDSTNFVFEQIMIPSFGGIAYDENAALYVGADYEEQGGNETEVLLVEAPGLKASAQRELEAEAVATRIQELVGKHRVFDKKLGEYRPASYGDIVILSRSVQGWADLYTEVLKKAGIPIYVSSKEGYFQTREIQLLLNYLRILDNPRQDIPFTSILTSVFAGVSTQELAMIQTESEGDTVYEKVCSYVANGHNAHLQTRLHTFIEMFESFRDKVPYTAIHTLLWQLMQETGYDNYVASLPAGAQRTANLEMLVEKAVAFEGTSYKGLFNFVRYMEQMQKYEVDFGEAGVANEHTDTVSFMSIHKSKGLEFPIVFVVGTNKRFNMSDATGNIVLHPNLGVGINRIDSQLRTKKSTLLQNMISQTVHKESAAEELRVLYVAMTRAKEKLILTGVVTDLEKLFSSKLSISHHKPIQLPYLTLTTANNYLDWIVAALFRNKCLTKILDRYGILQNQNAMIYERDVPIKVSTTSLLKLAYAEAVETVQNNFTKEILHNWDTMQTYDEHVKQQLEQQFSYRYPYADSGNVKQKISVSELKKQAYLDEATQDFKEEEVIPLLPKFIQEETEITGATKGTLYHKLLELLDLTRDYSEAELTSEIKRLIKEQSSHIRVKDIMRFLDSSIGKRVQLASRLGYYHAEQPFVLGVPVDSTDLMVVQGVVDVYFEEDGELVVLDYKTDRVSESSQLVERYRTQLDYYAHALERLTGKRVKEKLIYSFTLHQEIIL